MGNLNGENICNCENNDSNIENSFKTNQNSDKYLCPIYQNYNIDNGRNNKNIYNKIKETKNNNNKNNNKSKFNFNNYEMNFGFHTNNSTILKDGNKTKSRKKSIFKLNPSSNNDNIDIYDKKENGDNTNNKNENNIISIENVNGNDNDNSYRNKKQITIEKINSNKNLKTNEITSNSYNSNIKTNIDKPKNIPKNGLDIQIWGKNIYYIGYFKDGMAGGIGKLISGNNKYYGEYTND